VRRFLLALTLLLALGGQASARPGFPEGAEEPLQVTTAVQIVEVDAILDALQRFQATVDVRLTWQDPRLVFQSAPGEEPRIYLTGEAARARLRDMWIPDIQISNLVAALEKSVVEEGLLLDGNGQVQWFRRLEGEFVVHVDHSAFPFESQVLPVKFVSLQEDAQRLVLTYGLNMRTTANMQAPDPVGWRLSRLHIKPTTVQSWSGSTHSALTVEVHAARRAEAYYDSLFLPLIVTMMVPLLALMMNRWDGRRLVVEPFELAKLVVAGLLATIALSLATNTAYPYLLKSYNLVSELFILDYLLQVAALGVIVTFYREQMRPAPRVDPYLTRELFLALNWVPPLLTLIAAAALVVRRL
jgi:hypothetical protein